MITQEESKKPNILLITTDQQRFDTIAALGNSVIFTPHLNWMVDEGITFTSCYADCPICVPSRTTIMNGICGFNSGIVSNMNHSHVMNPKTTLPGILTANGYQTRAQGKMHFTPVRANYGFEHMELPMDYYHYMQKHSEHGIPKGHGIGENEMEPAISTVSEEYSLTRWTVDRSIDFIETRDKTRPFFLWTSFTKPHPPLDPCANYWNLYADDDIPDPVFGDWSENYDYMIKGFHTGTYSLNMIHRFSRRQVKKSKRAYYACITQIDYSLGLLFARMREEGLFNNTWIIFTSDHGDMMGDHHMGAKSMFFEGASHVPLIILPPKNQEMWFNETYGNKRRISNLVQLVDIYPTIMDIAGIPLKSINSKQIDGTSLLALNRSLSETYPEKRIFYGNVSDMVFAVYDNRLKYTWSAYGGDELLFDIQNDPYEQKNLGILDEWFPVLLEFRNMLLQHVASTRPGLIHDGKIRILPSPSPLQRRWPGFISLSVEGDTIH